MDRLSAQHISSITAQQGKTLTMNGSRDLPCPSNAPESAMPNSRRAFASDRALLVVRRPDQNHVTKGVNRRPRMRLAEQGMLMHLTVDSCDVTDLRRRVIAACGDMMLFMRIQPLSHASKMRVWILLQRQNIDLVVRAIKADMPEAEMATAE